jgi:hypothetical protein
VAVQVVDEDSSAPLARPLQPEVLDHGRGTSEDHEPVRDVGPVEMLRRKRAAERGFTNLPRSADEHCAFTGQALAQDLIIKSQLPRHVPPAKT